MDRELWPDTLSNPNVTILAVHRHGQQRRFLLNTSSDQLLDAAPPAELSAEQAERLDRITERGSHRPDGEDIWLTIAVAGAA